jgi:hypothetical protein
MKMEAEETESELTMMKDWVAGWRCAIEVEDTAVQFGTGRFEQLQQQMKTSL